ncbi:MAG TPA: SGNH/GDSL hydrolase family protein [Bacteroidota bacterium]|nr:SGNH/GDSL hydrolase family protein [Bacteroidota bacterium]
MPCWLQPGPLSERRSADCFPGRSITKGGVEPGGYVTLIKDTLLAKHPGWGLEVIGAGISGNKVPDIQKRLESDVLARSPTIVVIYIGINDVWHWRNNRGTPKDQYEAGLRDVVKKIQMAGARVVLCTPSVIGEKTDGTNQFDAMLDEYSSMSRRIATELNCRMCDLRRDFLDYLKMHNSSNQEKNILTKDGVHLNEQGNRFVADRILRTLERDE